MDQSGPTVTMSTGPNPAKPFTRGRSLSDMLRGLVLTPAPVGGIGGGVNSVMTINEEHDTVSALESSPTSGKPALRRRDTVDVIPTSHLSGATDSQPVTVNLGRLVETQGLTAATNLSTPAPSSAALGDTTANSNSAADAASGKSWSFFWKKSAEKVIDMNRNSQDTPNLATSGGSDDHSQSKILGAYLAQEKVSGVQSGGVISTNISSAPRQSSLLSAVTQGMAVQGREGLGGGPLGDAGRSGLLNLPDKVYVRKKEMNMFSPTSY